VVLGRKIRSPAAVLGYLVGDYFFLTPRAPPFGTGSSALEPMVYAAICAALIALVYRVYERERRLDSDPRRPRRYATGTR